MLSRRVLLAGFGASCLALPQSKFSLGCQTNAWAVDPANFDSLLAVLGTIRDLGFRGFETGFRNLQSQADNANPARKRIEETGLQFFGVHVFLTNYDPVTGIAPADVYERVAATGAALGAQRMILSGRPARDASSVAHKVEGLNRAASFAAKAGLKFAYHNHGPEFENSAREMQALLDGTDPGTVAFLLDAGHAFRAGADLPTFIKAHHTRLAGLHLRDFRDGRQVPLGAGTFPLRPVAAALKSTGWSGWVLAEEEREDGSKPGEKAAGPAFTAMKKELPG